MSYFADTTAGTVLALALLGSVAHGQGEPCEGYTFYGVTNNTTTKLIDLDENVIHTWTGASQAAFTPYLYPDGSILRPCKASPSYFNGTGVGGRFQIIAWDNTILWDYLWATQDYQQHHDIYAMPNGNVLIVAWERKTKAEAQAMGRQNLNNEMWPTRITEVQPDGQNDGIVVWDWHVWDHLIQDVDSSKPNYGVVSEHPELIDINAGALQSGGDWLHVNAVAYNEELDQVIFSSKKTSEIYIVDHSTTIDEAAGHTGGNCGKGGDLLYRWGNPQIYDRGDSGDQELFSVHSVHWIDPDLPGGRHILMYNNGDRAGNQNDYSSVEEITPPLLADGNYEIEDGQPYGPTELEWIYKDEANFYSATMSGAVRLSNGNTLICESNSGYLFEVTEQGEIVWDHNCGSVMRAFRYDYNYMSDCPADLNGDEEVDIDDLFQVLAAWGDCDDCAEDINEDGTVDIDDLFEVLADWGPCE